MLLAAGVITLVGALDDRFDLSPADQAARSGARGGDRRALRGRGQGDRAAFIGLLHFPNAGVTNAGPILTVIGLVAMMNVVNFSDGVDGLAAGVCAIIAAAMAVIAFDLNRQAPGVLAALTAGAALGFLVFNFPPASSFMGDCGANLLGLLMGVITVEAAVKTTAVVSLVLPLILLAVPFLDTTFVVLKRLKYRQPIYRPDNEHFHHRMARIGFSSRRTIAYLYAWTVMLAGLALALRFVPYSDHKGHIHAGWARSWSRFGLIVIAASVYLVYVLEILKFRRVDAIRLRRLRPGRLTARRSSTTSPGTWKPARSTLLPVSEGHGVVPMAGKGRAEQRIGQRKMDEHRVGAEDERGDAQAPVAADGR